MIILTGSTGFLGGHMLDALLNKNYSVGCLVRNKFNNTRPSDFVSYFTLEEAVEFFETHQPFAIIHCATYYGDDSEELFKTNVMLGMKLYELGVEYGVEKFLNTDTYFNSPGNNQLYKSGYTQSKKEFCEWLKFANKTEFKVINLKLQHVYGPRDKNGKFIKWFHDCLERGDELIELTAGKQVRDFIYVKDVCSAYITVLEINEKNLNGYAEYNIGTGVLIQLKDFLTMYQDEFNISRGKSKSELIFGAKDYRDGELMIVESDITKLSSLGWKPSYTLKEGIRETVNYGME